MEYTYKVHLYVVSQDCSLLMSPRDTLLGSFVGSGLTLFAWFSALFTASVVLLFTQSALFAEPSVGRVRGERMDKDAKSPRDCRHTYSLLAGTAAVAVGLLHALFVADPGHTALTWQ